MQRIYIPRTLAIVIIISSAHSAKRAEEKRFLFQRLSSCRLLPHDDDGYVTLLLSFDARSFSVVASALALSSPFLPRASFLYS